ncbi:Aldehyde dehydrogenase, partial [Quaeritorhiza haematococci]
MLSHSPDHDPNAMSLDEDEPLVKSWDNKAAAYANGDADDSDGSEKNQRRKKKRSAGKKKKGDPESIKTINSCSTTEVNGGTSTTDTSASEASVSEDDVLKYTDINEIPKIVESAREVFESGVTQPISWRKKQLRGIHNLLTEKESELCDALYKDLRKSRAESIMCEFIGTKEEAILAHGKVEEWTKPQRVPGIPMVNSVDVCEIRRQPLGVVLIIVPWNYPVHLSITPLISAIAAGNAVVLKLSEIVPHTSALLTNLLPLYLDPQAIRIINGGPAETTHLLTHRFDHIFYTGNGTIGRIVSAAAAKHLTPVTLELGGKSPVIVDDVQEGKVDLDVAAKRIFWAKTLNSGQTCVAPDYVLCCRGSLEGLLEGFRKAREQFYGRKNDERKADEGSSSNTTNNGKKGGALSSKKKKGGAAAAATKEGIEFDYSQYTHIVSRNHFNRLTTLLTAQLASSRTTRIFMGGRTSSSDLFIEPTILTGVGKDPETNPVMKDEIFGPILPILVVDSLQEAVQYINSRDKPLTLTLFTTNKSHTNYILQNTSSGSAMVNDMIMFLSVPTLPFGGVGPSGHGVYHGHHGFLTFSHTRS